jgi:hypothetical protein
MAAYPVSSPPVAGFIYFAEVATLSFIVTRLNRFAFATAHEFALQGFVSGIAPIPHACAATLMNGLFQR